jgi:hypothetical protein
LIRFDSELDKNGDMSLNREEILGWIVPSNEDIATEEVRQLCSTGTIFLSVGSGPYAIGFRNLGGVLHKVGYGSGQHGQDTLSLSSLLCL